MTYRLPIFAALLAGCALWGQPTTQPFEVASVKTVTRAPGEGPHNKAGVDRVEFRYATLWYCITYAYGVKSYQVFGPDWLRDSRYEILAKGPTGTVAEQMPKMMQELLAERFKLRVHHEKRELAGLALMVGKNGPKLKESAIESDDAQFGMSASVTGAERLEVTNAAMPKLASMLSALLGRSVIDKTGLTGRYNFVLEFSRSDMAGQKVSGGYKEPPSQPPPPPGAEPGLSIYSSIQQLGLKLDPQKIPLDVVVIDGADKTPTEN
jgi:uncharacterized protein (TIGR03435 family)